MLMLMLFTGHSYELELMVVISTGDGLNTCPTKDTPHRNSNPRPYSQILHP